MCPVHQAVLDLARPTQVPSVEQEHLHINRGGEDAEVMTSSLKTELGREAGLCLLHTHPHPTGRYRARRAAPHAFFLTTSLGGRSWPWPHASQGRRCPSLPGTCAVLGSVARVLHTCWSWNSRAQVPRLVMPPQCLHNRVGPLQGTPEKQRSRPGQPDHRGPAQCRAAGELWAAPQDQDRGMELTEGQGVPAP